MINIDDREKIPAPADTQRQLANHGIASEVTRLDAGDYQFLDGEGGLVLVSRKSNDLFSSVYSGHHNEEIRRCIGAVKQYGKGSVWFVLDLVAVPLRSGGIGVYTTTDNGQWLRLRDTANVSSPRFLEATQVSLWAAGVGTVIGDTARSLVTLWENSRKVKDGEWPSGIGRGIPRPTLKWHSQQSAVAHLVTLWPRLTERAASAMLSRHGSIAKIVELAQSDDGIKTLLETEGVGRKGIENFREVIS